jgi:hypothetical protein
MSEIFRYLTSRSNDDKYMDDAIDNHKRSIRRKATNFSVIDGTVVIRTMTYACTVLYVSINLLLCIGYKYILYT